VSSDLDQWQWQDEDPIEKLLSARKITRSAEPPSDITWESVAASEVIATPDPSKLHAIQTGSLVPSEAVDVAEAVQTFPPTPTSHQSDHNDNDCRYNRAISLVEREEWVEAANSFRQALELEPARTEALIGLGGCLLRLDRPEEALHYFEQCSFSSDDRDRVLLGIAVALQKLERSEEADWAYRELLQLNADAVEPLANMIALSVSRRDSMAVAEYSSRLIKLDPNSKTALQGLATCALWDVDYTAAIEYCTRLLEIDPTSFEAWSNLGLAKQMKMRAAEPKVRAIA
jgi:Flp pilus assembly protein TadD